MPGYLVGGVVVADGEMFVSRRSDGQGVGELAWSPSSPQQPLTNLRWRPGSDEWAVIGVDGPNGEDVFIGSPLRFESPPT